MVRALATKLCLAAAALSGANAYFLFGMTNTLTTERIDPIVSPGKVAGHTHTVVGGSNFRVSTSTSFLRQSECTTSPIKEDKSAYWAPTLYFHWKNGSFSSVSGAPVIYYLFSDTPGVTTPFPDDFRMLSGTPTLRSYNSSNYAQQAVTFLCLDFNGKSVRFNELPSQECKSGIRAQINFPSCWDGVNTDSPDHKSHVAYLSGGPDSGTCSDKRYPKTLPRIFMEMYLDTGSWWAMRDQAMNPNQPFVYAMGDSTGYGYHADFVNGWDSGVLKKVVDGCHCDPFGSPTCCANAGLFTYKQDTTCRITKGVDEIATGTLDKLPGDNPVVGLGGAAQSLAAPVTPALISPVYAYTGDSPTKTGSPVGSATTAKDTSTTSTGAPSSGGSASSGSSSPSGSSGGSSPGGSSPGGSSPGGPSSSNSGTGTPGSAPAKDSDASSGSTGSKSGSTGSKSGSTGSNSGSTGSKSGSTGSNSSSSSSSSGSSSSSHSTSSGSHSNAPACGRKGKGRHGGKRALREAIEAHSHRRHFGSAELDF